MREVRFTQVQCGLFFFRFFISLVFHLTFRLLPSCLRFFEHTGNLLNVHLEPLPSFRVISHQLTFAHSNPEHSFILLTLYTQPVVVMALALAHTRQTTRQRPQTWLCHLHMPSHAPTTTNVDTQWVCFKNFLK